MQNIESQQFTVRMVGVKGMKILLQNEKTSQFYMQGNQWTPEREAAFDFKLADALFDFVEQRQLKSVQLVVHFEELERLEVVPLETPAPRLQFHTRQL